jgi:hypothetical protein
MKRIKRISIVFHLSLLSGFLIAQEINLEQDLVARYLFEGNARNEVEDKNHGIETRVEYATDRYGHPDHCLFLSGDSSFVTIPHTEDLNWDARFESYSISFWFKSPDPSRDGDYTLRLLSKWSEYLPNPYPFSFQVSTDNIHPAIFDSNKPTLSYPIPGVWDGQWHHLVLVYDHRAYQSTSYLDNEAVASKIKEITQTTSNTSDIFIGKRPVTYRYYFGHMDDLYFYNRVLNVCEIEALFSGQLLEER